MVCSSVYYNIIVSPYINSINHFLPAHNVLDGRFRAPPRVRTQRHCSADER